MKKSIIGTALTLFMLCGLLSQTAFSKKYDPDTDNHLSQYTDRLGVTMYYWTHGRQGESQLRVNYNYALSVSHEDGVLRDEEPVYTPKNDGEGSLNSPTFKMTMIPYGTPIYATVSEGLEIQRCEDCYSENPCQIPVEFHSLMDINTEQNTREDVFQPVNSPQTVEFSDDDSTLQYIPEIGMHEMASYYFKPDKHIICTEENNFAPVGSALSQYYYHNERYSGHVLVLPQEVIDTLDRNKTYSTKELEAIIAAARGDESTNYFQSTAKLIGGSVADLSYSEFNITITNPTDKRDVGTIGLVLASDMVTAHFVDYEVEANSSIVKTVPVKGHMGGFDGMYYFGSNWSEHLNASIITFTDFDDLSGYQSAVDYERNDMDTNAVISQGSSEFNFETDAVVVCDGPIGDAWVNKYAGISRFHETYQNPNHNHNICKVEGT